MKYQMKILKYEETMLNETFSFSLTYIKIQLFIKKYLKSWKSISYLSECFKNYEINRNLI